MGYTIHQEIGKANRSNYSKVYIIVKFGNKKKRFASDFKVVYPLTKESKIAVDKFRISIENRLLNAYSKGIEITYGNVDSIVNLKMGNGVSIEKYTNELKERLKGRLHESTLEHYTSTINKLVSYKPDVAFSDINVKFLQEFESFVRKMTTSKNVDGKIVKMPLSQTSISVVGKTIKSILNKAREDGLVSEDQYRNYKTPKPKYPIPEYLTESEINKLYEFAKMIEDPNKKTCCYYFLLSCYTGWRLGDLLAFNKSKLKDGRVTIRAKKNGVIVSMPIHPKLQDLIDYVLAHPFPISEQKFRDNVKKVMPLIGIGKERNIKIHTARHSFAMMLKSKGFDLQEIAEYLGDSPEVTRVYARISESVLDKKLFDAMSV